MTPTQFAKLMGQIQEMLADAWDEGYLAAEADDETRQKQHTAGEIFIVLGPITRNPFRPEEKKRRA